MSEPFSHTSWRSDVRPEEPAVPGWYDVPESQAVDVNADRGIVWADEEFFVPLARSPYNNGHLHIVPRRAVTGYRTLSPGERERLGALIDRAIGWLEGAFDPDGFNVGFRDESSREDGKLVPFYVSVLPRWLGDTNFMITVHDTTVLPGSLDDSYRRIRREVSGSRSD